MRILAQLDVPEIQLLTQGGDPPLAGVAIRGLPGPGAAVFVDGHQVGELYEPLDIMPEARPIRLVVQLVLPTSRFAASSEAPKQEARG